MTKVASATRDKTMPGTSEIKYHASDNPLTNVSQTLQKRKHVDRPIFRNGNRHCDNMGCSQHYHCYGMHPACIVCLYWDRMEGRGFYSS